MTLEIGDHVWYWYDATNDVEHTSTDPDLPRLEWFPTSQNKTDYLGHGKEIAYYAFYDDCIQVGHPQMLSGPGTFAWLNRNPGNITDGGADFGQIPGKLSWHRFLVFPTREAGYDAIAQLLRTDKYIDLTIQAAFSRYAPASDGNDPVRYATQVANALGVEKDSTTIREVDDSGQLSVLQDSIAVMEGENNPGETLGYDSGDIPPAVQQLLA
jgi:hypothetical protein